MNYSSPKFFPFTGILFFISVIFLPSCSHTFDGQDGIKTVYFPNSEIVQQSVEYKNGKRDGLLQEFYRNGTLKTRQHYKEDKLNDSSIFYFENGTMAELQLFHDCRKNGTWKKFNQQGMPYEEMNFNEGDLEGQWNLYTYKTGRPKSLLNFKHGMKNGRQEYFYNNGKMKCILYFKDNEPCLGAKEWYDNGDTINNDFKISIEEHNKILLENTLRYFIRLENPKPDDEVFLMADSDTGRIATKVQLLKFEKDHFVLEYNVVKGGFVMETVRLAALRKTKLGNDFIKTTTFNVAENNY